MTSRASRLAIAFVGLGFVWLLPAIAGCGKKEPAPSVPGYYTGPMRPKNEVAPGPTGAPKGGARK
jgi:hypothetical protein